jgi:streptomycin 6-kinase
VLRLPEHFVRTIRGIHGARGEAWLQQLEELLHACEKRWGFVIGEPFQLSYNYVASVAMADGGEAVLKLGVPGHELSQELRALQHFGERGAVRLLDADEGTGLILLERLRPGATLKSVPDDAEATRCAAAVMKRLWGSEPVVLTGMESAFPSVEQWFGGLKKLRERYDGGTGPLPEMLVAQAEKLVQELLSSGNGSLYLLHGDLHHENILSSDRGGWLAIDPKGVIGQPEYEVVPYLMNHWPEHGVSELTKQRVRIFAEDLDLSEDRIRMWAFCHSVLSAWWHVDGDTGQQEAAVAAMYRFHELVR